MKTNKKKWAALAMLALTAAQGMHVYAVDAPETTEDRVAKLERIVQDIQAKQMKYFSVKSTGGTNVDNDGAKGTDSIVIGKDAQSNGQNSVAIGTGAVTNNDYEVAIGLGAKTSGGYAVSIGTLSSVKQHQGIAIGHKNTSYQYGITLGARNQASSSSVAIGSDLQVGNSDTDSNNSIALGKNINITKSLQSIALGTDMNITGAQQSMAMGVNNTIQSSKGAIVWGTGNQANNAAGSIVLGTDATAAGGYQSIVLGLRAHSSVGFGIALGADAKAKVAEGVALGYESVSDTPANIAGYDPLTGKSFVVDPKTHPRDFKPFQGRRAAVSIGSKEKNVTRQLTNLAAGTEPTDAVNVEQLKRTVQLNKNLQAATGLTDDEIAKINDPNEANKPPTLVARINALQNTVANANTHYVSIKGTAQDANSNYNNDGAKLESSIAIGENAHAEVVNGIAIGKGAFTDLPRRGPDGTVDNDKKSTSFGAVAIGDESSSQGSAIAIGKGARAVHRTNWDATDHSGIAIGRESYAENDSIVIGGFASARGNGIQTVVGFQALNDAQYGTVYGVQAKNYSYQGIAIGYQAKAGMASLGSTTSATGAIAIGYLAKSNGQGSVALGDNTIANNFSNVAIGDDTKATGSAAQAFGAQSRATGAGSLATGYHTQAKGENSIAQGYYAKSLSTQDIALGASTIAGTWITKAEYDKLTEAEKKLYRAATNDEGLGENIYINTDRRRSSGAIAIGPRSKANKLSGALGAYAKSGQYGLALGAYAKTDGAKFATALGYGASGAADQSTVVGLFANSVASAKRGTAIGTNANVSVENGVAIGSSSYAERNKDVVGYDPTGRVTGASIREEVANRLGQAEAFQRLHTELETMRTELEAKQAEMAPHDAAYKAAQDAYDDAYRHYLDLQDQAAALKNASNFDTEEGEKAYQAKVAEINKASAKIKELEVEKSKAAREYQAQAAGLKNEITELEKSVRQKEGELQNLSATWQSTSSVVSVGNEKLGITRQIINVAAGTKDTDAVNVAQLKGSVQLTKNLQVATGLTDDEITKINDPTVQDKPKTIIERIKDLEVNGGNVDITDNGDLYENKTNEGGKVVNNDNTPIVKDETSGKWYPDNGQGKPDTAQPETKPARVLKGIRYVGNVNTAEYKKTLGEEVKIYGNEDVKTKDGYVATNVITENTKDRLQILFAEKPEFKGVTATEKIEVGPANAPTTLINSDGVKTNKVATDVVQVDQHDYITNAGIDANNKKITNVADGTIGAGSKDAVNGSQLHTTNQNVADNTANIATNTGNIATNTGNIATNTGNIATNTAAIADNAGKIATNTNNIATNTANIATLQQGWTLSDGTNSTGIVAQDTLTVRGDDYITAAVTPDGDALTIQASQKLLKTIQDSSDAAQNFTVGADTNTTGNGINITKTNNHFDIKGVTNGDITTSQDGNTIHIDLSEKAKEAQKDLDNQVQGNTNALGGGANYDKDTDTYTRPTYTMYAPKGAVQTHTVGEALAHLDQGFKVTATTAPNTNGVVSGTSESAVRTNDLVTYLAGKNMAITQNGNSFTFGVVERPVFTGVTATDKIAVGPANAPTTQINSDGVTTNKVTTDVVRVDQHDYITNAGIDANNKKITNVADGTIGAGSKDAVNGSQLHTTNQNVADNAGKIATNTNNIATLQRGWTLSDGTNSTGIVAQDTLTVRGDDYIQAVVTKDGDALTIQASQKLLQKIQDSSDAAQNFTVGADTNATGNGINITKTNNHFDIKGVANGDITTSQDGNTIRIDLSEKAKEAQKDLDNQVQGNTNALGGGANYDKDKDTYTPPTYTMYAPAGPVQTHTVGEALAHLDQGFKVTAIAAPNTNGVVSGTSESAVRTNDLVTYLAGKNMAITQNGREFTFGVVERPEFKGVSLNNGADGQPGQTLTITVDQDGDAVIGKDGQTGVAKIVTEANIHDFIDGTPGTGGISRDDIHSVDFKVANGNTEVGKFTYDPLEAKKSLNLVAGEGLQWSVADGKWTLSLDPDAITGGGGTANKLDNSNTTVDDKGIIVGKDGKNGTVVIGKDGQDGNNGITITGPKGEDGKPGKTVIIRSDQVDMGGNRIENVAPGVEATDAVNKGQLDEAISGISTEIGNIGGQLGQIREDSKRGDALNAALSALKPIQFNPYERSQIMAGLGFYKGKHAVALGVGHYRNESTFFHAGLSYAGRSDLMANLGVTWRFGTKEDRDYLEKRPERYADGPISSVYVLQDEVTALMAEREAQEKRLQEQQAKIESQQEEMKLQRQMIEQMQEELKRLAGR